MEPGSTKTWLVAAFLVGLPALSFAQGARVQGQVLDESGQPIDGATVTLASEALGARRTATTDGQGRWAVLGLEGGGWTLEVEAEGYAPYETTLPVSAFSNPRPLEVRLGRAGPPPELVEAAERADAALEAGRFADARELYEGLLAQRPDLASTLHLQIARCYKEEGDVDREVEHLQKALDAAPDNHEVRTLLAMEVLERGEVERAMELLQAVDENRIASADVFYNIGVSFLNQGRREEAVAYFTKAVDVDAAYADGYLQRGLTYLGLEALDEAEADFEKVVALDPGGPQAETAAKVLEHIRSTSP